MLLRTLSVCLFLWSIAQSAGSVAEQESTAALQPEEVALQPEEVRVIGSRLDLSAAQQSGQVSVIDKDTIRALNKESVEQLLQALPGVSINRQGGSGGVTSLYLRGGEANFTVVMIDGVAVNNPTNTRGGSFDFSTLDVAMIERIEMIRGPQSAVYGADALSGALNIITRGAPQQGNGHARVEYGKDDYGSATLAVGGQWGDRGEYALSAGRTESGELVEGSESTISFVNARMALEMGSRLRAQASLRYTDSDRESFPEDSGGPELAVDRTLDQADSEDLSLGAQLHLDLNQAWSQQLDLSWFSLDSSETSPGIAPGSEVPPSGSDIDFDRYQLTWVQRLDFERVQLSGGLEWRREEGESEGFLDFGVIIPTDFELTRDTASAFVEVSWQPSVALLLSAGVRLDDPDEISSETTARLGLRYEFGSTDTVLRMSWGEGFKAPSFFALAHPLVGNPDLRSETAESWEVGLEQALLDSIWLNLAWFEIEYQDLIDFDDASFTNVNRDQVDSRGLEFAARWIPSGALRLSVHATWQDLDIQDSDDELRGRPEWKAGAQAVYEWSDQVSMAVEYLWVDEVVESSRYTGAALDYTLDDYATVDINMAWQARRDLRLELSVSNLLDEDYEQAVGFPAPGVFPRISAQYSF